MSLAHNGHSQFSDSNTGERDGKWMHNGLSELGRKAIAEMNRLGIMVDVSHPSKQSMMQTVALSKAPIIASHSAARALADHSRNMDDEQLLALKKNGGVIQTVAFNGYVKIAPPPSEARTAAIAGAAQGVRLDRPADRRRWRRAAVAVAVAAAAVRRGAGASCRRNGAPTTRSGWPRSTSRCRAPPRATVTRLRQLTSTTS